LALGVEPQWGSSNLPGVMIVGTLPIVPISEEEALEEKSNE
jgi:hypothetical protein